MGYDHSIDVIDDRPWQALSNRVQIAVKGSTSRGSNVLSMADVMVDWERNRHDKV